MIRDVVIILSEDGCTQSIYSFMKNFLNITENFRHKLENAAISETFLTAGELEEVTAGLERMQQPEM